MRLDIIINKYLDINLLILLAKRLIFKRKILIFNYAYINFLKKIIY